MKTRKEKDDKDIQIYKNIKKLRENMGLSQAKLGELAGYDRTSIVKIEKGQVDLPQSRIAKFAEIFGISETDLMRPISDSLINVSFLTDLAEPMVRIPVLGSVPAGIPVEAVQDIVGVAYVPESWMLAGHKYIGLKVKGSSMYPKYLDGDTIIIQLQDDCLSGQDCVAYIGDYETTLKTLYKEDDGRIRLQPINPEYQPKIYGPKDESVQLLGVVKQLIRTI